MRRAVYVFALAGVTPVVLCGLAGCSRPRAAAAEMDRPAVAVAKVSRGDLAQTLDVAAEFRPYQEIEVHAKVAGYVKAIYVDVGSRVQAGQLLAVLESPESRMRRTRMKPRRDAPRPRSNGRRAISSAPNRNTTSRTPARRDSRAY